MYNVMDRVIRRLENNADQINRVDNEKNFYQFLSRRILPLFVFYTLTYGVPIAGD